MDDPDDKSSSDESLSSEESPSYTSSNPSSSQNEQKSVTEKVSLSHNETKAVNRSKILVYIALVVCAFVTGAGVYQIARASEKQNFEKAVRNDLLA